MKKNHIFNVCSKAYFTFKKTIKTVSKMTNSMFLKVNRKQSIKYGYISSIK